MHIRDCDVISSCRIWSHLDNLSKAVYLHDGEADGAEVDGGLEGGHCLGVSQTVQTVLIHLEQQVTLLQIVSTVSTASTKYSEFSKYSKYSKYSEYRVQLSNKSPFCKHHSQSSQWCDSLIESRDISFPCKSPLPWQCSGDKVKDYDGEWLVSTKREMSDIGYNSTQKCLMNIKIQQTVLTLSLYPSFLFQICWA